jgi:hypothetical protein
VSDDCVEQKTILRSTVMVFMAKADIRRFVVPQRRVQRVRALLYFRSRKCQLIEMRYE